MAKNTMTRAEREAAMAEALEKAQGLTQRYNEITQAAWDGEEYDPKELVDTQAAIDEACADFNHNAKILTYLDCKSTADAFGRFVAEIAAERLRYKVIGVKDSKVADDLCPVREVVEKVKDIDLIDMDKTLSGNVCASKDWKPIAQRLNHLIVYASCVQLGADYTKVRDCLGLKEIHDAIQRGEAPMSRRNMREAFRKAIAAIIGEAGLVLWDMEMPERDIEGNPLTVGDTAVNYAVRVFSKKGKKALSIACGNNKASVQILMDISHRLLTGASFSVESKEIKEESTAKAPKKESAPVIAPEILSQIEDLSVDELRALARVIRQRKAEIKSGEEA